VSGLNIHLFVAKISGRGRILWLALRYPSEGLSLLGAWLSLWLYRLRSPFSRLAFRCYLFRSQLVGAYQDFVMRRSLRKLVAKGFVITPEIRDLLGELFTHDLDFEDQEAQRARRNAAFLRYIEELKKFSRSLGHGPELAARLDALASGKGAAK
jgi:hypothetical protein